MRGKVSSDSSILDSKLLTIGGTEIIELGEGIPPFCLLLKYNAGATGSRKKDATEEQKAEKGCDW
jgi:hypothetical protein